MAGDGNCRQATRPTVSDGDEVGAAQPGKNGALAEPLDAAKAGVTPTAAARLTAARTARAGRMADHSRQGRSLLPPAGSGPSAEKRSGEITVDRSPRRTPHAPAPPPRCPRT